jgi:hypothetical protein
MKIYAGVEIQIYTSTTTLDIIKRRASRHGRFTSIERESYAQWIGRTASVV